MPRPNLKTDPRFCRLTHGQSRTKTYFVWKGMRQRCRSAKAYAGKGITVCDRWNSFENFLADMGERPLGLTIDRIDNNGHYEPGNCRWATRSVQQKNRSPNAVSGLERWWKRAVAQSVG